MDVLLIVLAGAFALSAQGNFWLYHKYKSALKKPQMSVEAQKVLAELASGSAVLRIDVIDPGDFLLRRS